MCFRELKYKFFGRGVFPESSEKLLDIVCLVEHRALFSYIAIMTTLAGFLSLVQHPVVLNQEYIQPDLTDVFYSLWQENPESLPRL